MKAEFAAALRCPVCHCDRALDLSVSADDGREIREGTLRCHACDSEFPVRRGVPELLHEPPEHVRAEADGLERFADHMRALGWDREMVLTLPHHDNGYWYVQWRSFHQLLSSVGFVPDATVVDIGSNTCWAANQFARSGLRAIALDIATAELQGLYTADYFLDGGDVYFERVLGSMNAIPLASASVDYVFCCEVLHHNDPAGLRRTFTEAFRILRPGGRLLMINETLKTVRDPHGVHIDPVAPFEGYEHAYWAWRYRWEATRAGFYTEVMEPHYRPFFGDASVSSDSDAGLLRATAARVATRLQRHGVARRAYLAWLNHVWGGVSMNMVATKPYRFATRSEGAGPARRMAGMLAAGVAMQIARALRRPAAVPRLPRTPEEAARRGVEFAAAAQRSDASARRAGEPEPVPPR